MSALIARVKAGCGIRHYIVFGLLLLASLGGAMWAFGGVTLVSKWHSDMPVADAKTAVMRAQAELPKLVATYRDVPPDMLTYSLGRHSGPLRYVLEEAVGKIGYAIEWQPAPFADSLDMAGNGSIDIVPYARFKTAEREKTLRFSVSLGRVPTAISFLQHADDPRVIRTLEDLKGLSVGYRPGTYYFEEFASDPRFKRVGYTDDKKLVKGFIDRKVDVIIVSVKQATERALAAAGYSAKNYKYAELVFASEADLYLIYTRAAQRQELFDRLDQALLQMKEEGVIADIYKSFEAEPPKAK